MAADDEITPVLPQGCEVVFVVFEGGGQLSGLAMHAAYRHGGNAEAHARCIGGGVVALQLLERVPASVVENRVDGEFDRSATVADALVFPLALDDFEG